MTLFEACEIGNACGLTTIQEAITNIEIHAPSLFNYNNIDIELKELYNEIKDNHIDPTLTTISLYLFLKKNFGKM